ncbi:phosphoribosylglycinamide formyltransferase [Reichenbachiella agariperforans]|uniref:phosphoribosylglycinamide formyltransferase n=1 Tax=Reichenbachiella agariperforans TaxID=156994 RepID=UPI001C0A4CB2|nr:phosphoribosylglycinamide formyltransferase [Reichenbachiella agariperforans]MBU2915580.1 phosphoribosylglycinamide formyltransferase [Reichenbachiella agariperforans]
MGKIKIAIFASGSGSNAEQITNYFSGHDLIEVVLILSNKPTAYVLERAAKLGVPSQVFDRPTFYQSENVLDSLRTHEVDYIVLAGFLWLVPQYLIEAYREKMINIHPALLPKYGGKGMYGDRVHRAVIADQETESGITIHLVDEVYDNGRILCQERVSLVADDTPDSLAEKIHELEYAYFPKAIESYLLEHKG